MQMLQQQKGQMQRDPSDMDGSRPRPSSPGSTDNAPSPSKRPRLDGTPFNPGQGAMMANGRPVGQGMPGQQVGSGAPTPNQVHRMLVGNGIDPTQLTPDQMQTLASQSQAVQQKTIATYAQNLQQHHNNQLPNKAIANTMGPQAQGSPMIAQTPDGAALNAYYNAGDMGPAGTMRPGPGGAQGSGGSNHALQDYQMQLMLLEQQNKKRLMMARQEQDGMTGLTRADGGPAGQGPPGAPQGPAGAQPFQGASPQGARTGASPNPAEQMKRNNQHMGAAGVGSPLPENPQSRGSPGAMNFMAAGGQIDPTAAPNFFGGGKGMNNMEGNMAAVGMNGMRPPSSHPGQFNGQMNPQQMMQARQQAQQAQQGVPQMQQWQQGGPNGNQMGPQGQQLQGTPQQRAMPPPSAPGAANATQRTQTASPQTSNAAPPTPSQSAKAAPKKKDNKGAKNKVRALPSATQNTCVPMSDLPRQAATQKKSATNLNAGATPASEAPAEPEVPTPATPITPVNAASFSKNAPNAAAAAMSNGQAAPPPPAAAAAPPPPTHPDPSQFGIGDMGVSVTNLATVATRRADSSIKDFGMDFANPLTGPDVLNDFDFDSFLHDNTNDDTGFDFGGGSFNIGDSGEIGAD
jgi:hypothetical protein